MSTQFPIKVSSFLQAFARHQSYHVGRLVLARNSVVWHSRRHFSAVQCSDRNFRHNRKNQIKLATCEENAEMTLSQTTFWGSRYCTWDSVSRIDHGMSTQIMSLIVGFSHSYFRKSKRFNTFWMVHHLAPLFYLISETKSALRLEEMQALYVFLSYC